MPESSEPMRFVIDTDAANEIDDQFAIACGLSAERLEALVESSPTALGMQRRYEEIVRILEG